MTISGAALDSAYQSIQAVNSVIALENANYTAQTTSKVEVDSAVTSISSLATKLSQLSTAADTLSDPSGFYAWSATSTDSAVVASVTAPPPPEVPQSFAVSVSKLATAQRTVSDARDSASQALGMTGVVAINVGSTTKNVSVAASDSLDDIAAKINASGARVSASVDFDANSGSYTLAVQGLDTGAANGFSLRETGAGHVAGTHLLSSLGLYRAGNTSQVAQDAAFSIDGVARSSSTNQVKNAVAGVDLALTSTTAGSATVTLSSVTVLHTNLANFVSAYNGVVTAGHAAAGFGGQPAAAPQLADDASVSSSLDQVANLISAPVGANPNSYDTLASIGLERDAQTGLLSLNDQMLSDAIANDPVGVQQLFVTNSIDQTSGAMQSFHLTIGGLTGSGSLLQQRTNQLTAQSSALGNQSAATQTRLDGYQNVLHDLLVSLAAQMAAP